MTKQNQQSLYLASASPRRAELLMQIGVRFERISATIDEARLPDEAVLTYTQRLAQGKAMAGWEAVKAADLPCWPVLGADTIVELDGDILGKPRDAAAAYAMLRRLSGKRHRVFSSVCVMDQHRLVMDTAVTEVTFSVLSDSDIQRYIHTGEPFDKAGGYGIQGLAGIFITHIQGSYSGVVGLPIYETVKLLNGFGFIFP